MSKQKYHSVKTYFLQLPQKRQMEIIEGWEEQERKFIPFAQSPYGMYDMHRMQDRKHALIDDILFELRISPIGQAIDDFLFNLKHKGDK